MTKTTKVTWLGDGSDAEETEAYGGTVFPKDKAVDVKDERVVEKAKANKFFKVSGDDSETVEDNPVPQPSIGREDDVPENIAFASQERLDAHREMSIERGEINDERVERAQGKRGRPPGSKNKPKGGSETFNERHAPKGRRKAHATPRAEQESEGPTGLGG